jgi:hypothetical protein
MEQYWKNSNVMFGGDKSKHACIAALLPGVIALFKSVSPIAIILGFLAAFPMEGQLPTPTGGASTGGIFPAVHDAKHQPITAGGFVSSGSRIFEDVTQRSGLGSWAHRMGNPDKRYIIETDGSGVGLLDYDNDGWLDIYLVNGSTYEALAGKANPPHAALFHNNHDGTFTNVANQAGVENDRWGFGVAIGDYDNDGWPYIYVTNFGENRLYHNNHDGTFTDVAVTAGVALSNWSTGATFGDYDGDGRLDLFVPGYVHYEVANPPQSGTDAASFHYCQFRGIDVSCGPRGLKGEQNHLFHNNGDGTFTDVSKKAGVEDARGNYGFTALFADLNGDGKADLIVANDSTSNYFYANQGNGTFADESYSSGLAVNGDGRGVAAMGLAVGDYRNTGRLDVAITDFSDDYDVLFRNDGNGMFTDVSAAAGLVETTTPFLGWGIGFLDYDNDGWKDLFITNGHVYPIVDRNDWGTSYAERPLLLHNLHGRSFEEVPPVKDTGLAIVTSGRGVAYGDLFNDGKIDVVINNLDQAPTLLRNVSRDHHSWVELKLIGGPRSPRDAIGTSVYLTANGIRQRGDVLSGGSFMSSNDQRIHFGLGNAQKVSSVEIHWTSGLTEHVHLPGINRIFTVEEGKGIIR